MPYFNFNLVKDAYYTRVDNQYYDTNHLNGDGAAYFSKALATLLADTQLAIQTQPTHFYDLFTQM